MNDKCDKAWGDSEYWDLVDHKSSCPKWGDDEDICSCTCGEDVDVERLRKAVTYYRRVADNYQSAFYRGRDITSAYSDAFNKIASLSSVITDIANQNLRGD